MSSGRFDVFRAGPSPALGHHKAVRVTLIHRISRRNVLHGLEKSLKFCVSVSSECISLLCLFMCRTSINQSEYIACSCSSVRIVELSANFALRMNTFPLDSLSVEWNSAVLPAVSLFKLLIGKREYWIWIITEKMGLAWLFPRYDSRLIITLNELLKYADRNNRLTSFTLSVEFIIGKHE